MRLNLRKPPDDATAGTDYHRYERVCARCGVANPFVHETCARCGALMSGAPAVAITADAVAPRPPSQLGQPAFSIDNIQLLPKDKSGAVDEEARWEKYWQQASGQAPSAPAYIPPWSSATLSPPTPPPIAHTDYEYADVAPGSRRRALRRTPTLWAGVCALTLMVGMMAYGAVVWKQKEWKQHERQAAQRKAHLRVAQRRVALVQRSLGYGQAARKTTGSRKASSRKASKARVASAKQTRQKSAQGSVVSLPTSPPAWTNRWRWIASFWRGYQSRGRDAGNVRPVYTRAVRDWERRHNRRQLEVRNN